MSSPIFVGIRQTLFRKKYVKLNIMHRNYRKAKLTLGKKLIYKNNTPIPPSKKRKEKIFRSMNFEKNQHQMKHELTNNYLTPCFS